MRRKTTRKKILKRAVVSPRSRPGFDQVLALIQAARTRAIAAVNTELIDLYWSIGRRISGKISAAGWAKAPSSTSPSSCKNVSPTSTDFPPAISGA